MRGSNVLEELYAFEARVTHEVEQAIAAARDVGRAGDLVCALRYIDDAIEQLKRRRFEGDDWRRTFAADAQERRLEISKKGRLLSELAGRGSFGNGVRSGFRASRERGRTDLWRFSAEVRSEFDRISLTFDKLRRQLFDEKRHIGEMRARR